MSEPAVTSSAAPDDALEVSFVIPVFDEPESIGPTLRGLEAAVRSRHEVLVVYDFDADTTVPVVRSLQADMPAVRLLRNDLGRGVLNAMRAGMADARAPYVIVSMADGSDDHRVVDAMVALARSGADVVAASRYMRGGAQIGGPPLKRLMSRAAGLSLYWLGGVATHDPTNNFKLYSRRFLDSVTIESVAGFELALELTVKATLAGLEVREVPAVWRDRAAGESRFRLRAWLPHYLRWYGALFAGRARALVPGMGRGIGRPS
jgi:glycosyltransferase involved in cell wall biosynthesis